MDCSTVYREEAYATVVFENGTLAGDEVQYQCDSGLTNSGYNTSKCLNWDGVWSHPEIDCRGE